MNNKIKCSWLICFMVDSNIQREDILPSEKAKAYAMKYEALKHQGKREGGSTFNPHKYGSLGNS